MLILLETPAGFALFQVTNEKKLSKIEDISEFVKDTDKASKLIQLRAFQKFKDTADALKATNKLIKGKLPKTLSKFLKTNIISQEIQDTLEICDKKLGKVITEKLGIQCNTSQLDLFRALREQVANLVTGLTEEDLKKMTLGLAHGLSRYKLQFTAEKVDQMIIQAISLLDDLDKELNNYMMRLREWYGWHFPEMSKIIGDNLIYAKTVKLLGQRTRAAELDLSEILQEDIEKEVKQAAEISMGTEINEIDEKYILSLADQVIELSTYRQTLSDYLKNRMQAIAPNLTTMVGELVGARLIAHAGSLINLAKHPASTVQILGAEKALFKAIRSRKNTPKYGLIYQASIVGQVAQKIKGKVSRTLSAKCALCIRYDALGEAENAEIGIESKNYVDKRVKYLQAQELKGGKAPVARKIFNNNQQDQQYGGGYNQKNDIVIESESVFKSKFKKSEQTLDSSTLKRKASENEDVNQIEEDSTLKKKKNK